MPFCYPIDIIVWPSYSAHYLHILASNCMIMENLCFKKVSPNSSRNSFSTYIPVDLALPLVWSVASQHLTPDWDCIIIAEFCHGWPKFTCLYIFCSLGVVSMAFVMVVADQLYKGCSRVNVDQSISHVVQEPLMIQLKNTTNAVAWLQVDSTFYQQWMNIEVWVLKHVYHCHMNNMLLDGAPAPDVWPISMDQYLSEMWCCTTVFYMPSSKSAFLEVHCSRLKHK